MKQLDNIKEDERYPDSFEISEIKEVNPNDFVEIEEYNVNPINIDLKGYASKEDIVWSGHPHIISEFGQILIASFLLVFSLFIIPYSFISEFEFILGDYGLNWTHIGILGMISSVIIYTTSYIAIKFTRYVLTDQALYIQQGLIRRKVRRLPADTIQTHEYKQTIMERILRFGTIEVTTAGTDDIELRYKSIPNPKRIHLLIGELIENRTYNFHNKNDVKSNDDILARLDDISNSIDKK